MPNTAEEIAALRSEVAALKALSLTAEQRAAVDRLTDHVEQLVAMVQADTFRRTFLTTIRSWAVAIAAVVAATWAVKDGLARAIKAMIDQ